MKHSVLCLLLMLGILSAAPMMQGQDGDNTEITPSAPVQSRGAAHERADSNTWSLAGCLLTGAREDEYLLLGPNADEWILKSKSFDLSVYRYRKVKVTVVESAYNEGPLSVIAVTIEPGSCPYQ